MIDLHLHTTASDGLLGPAELVHLAAAAGLTTIAVTDHDTVAGLAQARAAAASAVIAFVDGIEVTAVEDGRDVHVLGYFLDPEASALATFLQVQREDRIRRVAGIGERLRVLGYAIDVDRLVEHVRLHPGRSIGRPRVADALVAAGYAVDRRDAFERLLGAGRPAFVPRRGPTVAEVVEIIAAAGGITSMAHPGLTAMDERIPGFASAGLDAIEARHSDHDADAEARYRRLAAELGLAVSGGSDFHGDPSQHIPALGLVTLPRADFTGLAARAAARREQASR